MDIFKLIYEHDLRLEALRKRHTDRSSQDLELSLEALMRPDPTYSRFYLTGTRIDRERFGLDTLDRYGEILRVVETVLQGYRIFASADSGYDSLREAIEAVPIGPALLLTRHEAPQSDPLPLGLDDSSNVGHRKEPLREALVRDDLVLYKEKAHHGFDLHLFSKKNLYRELFFPFQKLLEPGFRFFSINGKRIQSEKKFYFETWALERPPHGIEEVFEQTVL